MQFTYKKTKEGKLFIYSNNKLVKTLKGAEAAAIIDELNALDDIKDQQYLLAVETGQFKFGNERTAKMVRKNKGRD